MTYHNTGQIQPEILWGLSKSENLRKRNQYINCDFIDALFQLLESLKKNETKMIIPTYNGRILEMNEEK